MAIVGYVLLGTLAAVLAFLCVPLRLRVLYETGKEPQAALRWLFLRYDLLGAKPKKQKPKAEPEKPAKQKEGPKREKKPQEFSEMLGAAVDLLGSLRGGGGMLARNFRVYKLRLFLLVAEGDAAETGIAYGRCNAAVYSAYAAAKNFLNLARPEVEIRPDFTAPEGRVEFEARGRLVPLVAAAAAARIACAFLVKTIRRRKAEGGQTAGTGRNTNG